MSNRKNQWVHVTFEDIRDYIEREEIAQLAFSRDIGITNSTFHNWKKGTSIPDEAMQLKIQKKIQKKGGASSKTSKPKGRKAKGDTLDDLMSQTGRRRRSASPKKASKPTAKASTGVKKTSLSKKQSPTAAKTAANGNGNGHKVNGHHKPSTPIMMTVPSSVDHDGTVQMTERAFLIQSYTRNNKVKNIEEYGRLIQTVSSALN